MLLDDSLLLTDYLTHQEASSLRPGSIKQSTYQLEGASRWLLQNRKCSLSNAAPLDLTAYMAWKGRELKDLPLPRAVGREDVRRLIDGCCAWTWMGCRDVAFLRCLYESGVRVGELAKVQLSDVDLTRREIKIRHPKSSRERVALIGEGAALSLARWIERREEIGGETGALWISEHAVTISAAAWSARISKLGHNSGTTQPVTAHVLRHSFATHLLEAGADIRTLQDLLGHASVQMTQRYCAVVPARRREVRDLLPIL